MKKSLIILILSLLAISLPAQAEHLKFMGIPLTGSITQFQQKLAAKGVTHDKKTSAIADMGTRVFSGKFAGEKAKIVVWYDAQTKIVYGAKAVYECYSTKSRDNKYNELKPMLIQKYAEENIEETTEDGLERIKIYITNQDATEQVGGVALYRSEEDYGDIYYVHVEYIDFENYGKNQDSKMNDL